MYQQLKPGHPTRPTDKDPTVPRPPWTLEELLSRDRLQPYLAATRGDQAAAIQLYGWNSQVSAAFYESLHYLEIGLRNAMDQQLTSWAAAIGAAQPWYVDPAVPLTPPTRRKIAEARDFATRGAITEIHGKVIAELTLGFWWTLLSGKYNRRLWQPCLTHAFDSPVRRERLHSSLYELRLLRNRIAHHEPIHNRDLDAAYRLLLGTAGRISPMLCTHIDTTSRLPATLASRPTAAPEPPRL